MATALKLRSDIKKLKGAIASSKTPKNFIPKLKAQLEKAENELSALKGGAKPRKVSTTKGSKSLLEKAKALVKKNPKYSGYKGSGVDLKKDAEEGALAVGRRVSKGIKGNQYASKKEAKGNVYYEYRVNRLDVKQPKGKQSYPKLEDGGYMANGGEILSFEKKIKDALKEENKWHFINEEVDGKNVQLKMFVGKKEVDVQIFRINGLGAKMPRNYVGKRETLKMIMDNFQHIMEDGGIAEGYHQMPDGSIMADSAHMAKGGMVEHGLEVGDKVVSRFNNVIVVENDGKTFVINLNVGKRWSENQWFALNHGDNSKFSKMAHGGKLGEVHSKTHRYDK